MYSLLFKHLVKDLPNVLQQLYLHAFFDIHHYPIWSRSFPSFHSAKGRVDVFNWVGWISGLRAFLCCIDLYNIFQCKNYISRFTSAFVSIRVAILWFANNHLPLLLLSCPCCLLLGFSWYMYFVLPSIFTFFPNHFCRVCVFFLSFVWHFHLCFISIFCILPFIVKDSLFSSCLFSLPPTFSQLSIVMFPDCLCI